MHSVDYIILIFLLLSTLISFFQPLLKEVLSLIAWLVSLFTALLFLESFANSVLKTAIPYVDLRYATSLILLFIFTFLVTSVVNYLLLNTFGRHKPVLFERFVSILLGSMRGCVMLVLLILIVGLTKLPTFSWWQTSFLLPYFETIAVLLVKLLPTELAQQFNYPLSLYIPG